MGKDGKTAVNLRLDEALRQQIAAAAQASIRSLNSEILFRLKRSFERQQSDELSAS